MQAEHPEAMGLVTAENQFPNAMTEIMHDNVGRYLSIRETSNLAQSCRWMNALFQPKLNELEVQRLLQAVINNDQKTVKKLLARKPELLLVAPDKRLVLESQCTWQRFDVQNKNALAVAAKRKQLQMVELLLSYCDKFLLIMDKVRQQYSLDTEQDDDRRCVIS